MNKPQSLDTALNSAPTIIKLYVRALRSENLKLQKQLAKLYAQNISRRHEIVCLKGELKKLGYKNPSDKLAEQIREARARVVQHKEHAPTA